MDAESGHSKRLVPSIAVAAIAVFRCVLAAANMLRSFTHAPQETPVTFLERLGLLCRERNGTTPTADCTVLACGDYGTTKRGRLSDNATDASMRALVLLRRGNPPTA